MGIVEWCNLNQGFVSAILAFTSILLSVIAIIASIKAAKIPFKKNIAVAFYTNLGVGLNSGVEFYSIEATNIGNRVIKASYVGAAYKENGTWMKLYNKSNPNPTNVMISVNETITAQYDVAEFNAIISKKKVYAIAIDVEGKMYKRKIK